MKAALRLCPPFSLHALLVLLCFIGSAGVAVKPAFAQTWQPIAPLPAPEASSASVTGPDGRIYLFGGANNLLALNSARVFDPKTNAWSDLPPMPTPRFGLIAAVGSDGRIYAIGGGQGADVLTTVEAYDPRTNAWKTVTPMLKPRDRPAVAVDFQGRIYAIGGVTPNAKGQYDLLASVERYDPRTDTWEAVADLKKANSGFAAVTGLDGMIYVIGGEGDIYTPPSTATGTVVRYDPATNTWQDLARIPGVRYYHGAALGPDGRIYVVGGERDDDVASQAQNTFTTTDVQAYDPKSNTWTASTPLPEPLVNVAVNSGPEGKIYALGGYAGTINTLKTTPLALALTFPVVRANQRPFAYDNQSTTDAGTALLTPLYASDPDFDRLKYVVTQPPQHGKLTGVAPNLSYIPDDGYAGPDSFVWKASDGLDDSAPAHFTINVVHVNHAPFAENQINPPVAMAVAQGKVAVTLSVTDPDNDSLTYTLVNQPANGTLTGTAPSLTYSPNAGFIGTDSFTWKVNDGTVDSNLATVSIAVSKDGSYWTRVASMPTPRYGFAAVRGPDGRIYVMGGFDDASSLPSSVLAYDTSTDTWTPVADLPTPRYDLAAALGSDGRIYAIGGVSGSSVTTVEAYDVKTNTWATVAPLQTQRYNLGAAADSQGRIYAVGGQVFSLLTPSVERYDPAKNQWEYVADLLEKDGNSEFGTAADGSGRIFTFGGNVDYGKGPAGTARRYTPATNLWEAVAALPSARYDLAAALGPDGLIYALGGQFGPSLATAEAYDSKTDTWSTALPMPVTRTQFAAASGPNGALYAMGGFSTDANGNVSILSRVDALVLPFTVTHISSLTLTPETVNGGTTALGTVTLDRPAGAGGVTVTLSSSDPSATVPANVTVLESKTTATFTVSTQAVLAATSATIKASIGSGSAQSKVLTIQKAEVNCADPNAPCLNVAGAAGLPGGIVPVSINANAKVANLASLTLTLQYDPNLLDLASGDILMTGSILGSATLQVDVATPGTAILRFTSNKNVNGPGKVATLNFHLKATVAPGTITPLALKADAKDVAGKSLQIGTQGGQISAAMLCKGDFNGDTKVNIQDVQLLLRMAIGLTPLPDGCQ